MKLPAQTTRACYYGNDLDGLREIRKDHLPIRAESLAQLGRGKVQAEAAVVSGSAGVVYYARILAPVASTMADLDEAYTGFVIPLSWDGKFVINGQNVCASSIYVPVDKTFFQVYGSNRETANFAMRREEFVATVAALQGIAPGEVQLGEGSMKAPPAAMARLRRSLISVLSGHLEADQESELPPGAHDLLTRNVAEILTDVYLHARPAPVQAIRKPAKLATIIRKAEERFESARSEPVSLADLCAATGVSHRTLHDAFMVMCGVSPMAHFKKRRLTDARLSLLAPKPNRNRVKSAALDAGLSHLGRFSTEYRELFGESPSVTLNRNST